MLKSYKIDTLSEQIFGKSSMKGGYRTFKTSEKKCSIFNKSNFLPVWQQISERDVYLLQITLFKLILLAFNQKYNLGQNEKNKQMNKPVSIH